MSEGELHCPGCGASTSGGSLCGSCKRRADRYDDAVTIVLSHSQPPIGSEYRKAAEFQALLDAYFELRAATQAFGSMVSAHEGFAILKEEVDELWEEIRKKPTVRDPEEMRVEAMQVAAMALRFMVDICMKERSR